jgi:hypothetical protein
LKVRLILQSNLLCFLNCLDKGGTWNYAIGYKITCITSYNCSWHLWYSTLCTTTNDKWGVPNRNAKYALVIHYEYISLADKPFHLL